MESIIGFSALVFGGLWIYSVIKGRSLKDDTIAVLRGEPMKPVTTGVGSLPDTGEAPPVPTIDEQIPSTPGVIRTPIGQGTYWLAPQAAAAFRQAENIVGTQIKLVSAGRTREEQIALRRKNGCPDVFNSPSSSCRVPTARPGTSQHEFGNAVDIHAAMRNDQRVINAMTQTGWCRYSPKKEPWHWAWRVCK
jgi:hypothetical protein